MYTTKFQLCLLRKSSVVNKNENLDKNLVILMYERGQNGNLSCKDGKMVILSYKEGKMVILS